MSRDHSASTISLTQSTPMPSRINANQSRIPIKAKRPILGERVDNYDHSTPRQHLVKPVKSVVIPRISSTKSNTNASPRKASHPTPPRATSHGFSPASSILSSPAGANVSRPGHTPHPRRSSVGLSFLIDKDMSMLADTSRPDFLVSDTDESEADEPGGRMLARRGVRGPGRLMTPANSQESQSNSQEHTHRAPSPRRMAMRLPTPPASQPGTDIEETLTRTLVRPRPAPTPPRQSATPSIRLNGSIAGITQEISPNPRRKKSPRVDEAGPSRLRSPFELAPAAAPATASPRHPRDRVEIVIGRSPRTTTPSATPKASKGPRKARVSTKTPSASHPLSQSTGSQPSRSKKAPATAPQANRRKSTPAASRRQSTPQTTNGKVKYAKSPRLSVPGRSRSRKSVTPAELKAMAGLLPEPVEQGSPSDDPLLLVPDDDAYLRKTPAVRPSSHSGKSTGSRSAARIIDFDAAIAQGSARSSNAREIVTDYEVPLQGSEADHYDAGPDWGFGSGGDSDNDDMGNDTFLHVAGARAKSGSDSLMARPAEEMEPIREASPAFSRSSLPFLPIPSTSQADREQSPGPPILAASPARAATPRLLASPVIAAASPISSIPAASPAREATPRKLASPVIAAASPVPSISGMPSPAATSHAMASPHSQRSRSATPVVPQLDPAGQRFSPAPSPRCRQDKHLESTAVSISRLNSPITARSSTATPKLDAVALRELGSPPVDCEDTIIRASPVLSGKLSVGMLSNDSLPMATKSHTATPSKADTTESHLSPLPTPRSSFQEAVVNEEQIHDSWSSGSPLRLPSTPSALGLFMAEEADAMSTPFSHAPEPEADTPASKLASPSLSTTPRSVVNEALPVVYTHSPRRSPICLPKQVAQENDVPSTIDEETEAEEEEEDKENHGPTPVQSTTPLFSPPTLKATPPMYPLSFSPRIASPLRTTHNIQGSPRKLASHSPIPPIETLHSRFADEEEECPSADVTLEGNSADWSLSDEGVDEVEREELSYNSTPEPMADEEELLEDVEESALVDEQEEADGNEELDDVEGEDSGSHPLDVASSHEAPQKLDEPIKVSMEEIVDNTAEESVERPDDNPLQQLEENHLPEEALSNSTEQDEQDDASDRTDPEEGASSDTLADDAGFESSRDDMAEKEVEEEPEHDHGHERLPAPEPRVVVQEKIVLKLISRGIVKVEPEDIAPASLAPNAAKFTAPQETESEERSTTPAYDPPQLTVMARSAKAPTPARSMYPDLPATPTFAPLSPLPSTTPLGSPARQPASLVRTSGQTPAQAGPSARPRSQLSRRLDSPEPIDEADKSIRLRSVRSLGDEFDDADADNSMRSVVEVSSLDPKAAARAAAILKLNHAYIEHGDISKLGESAKSTSPRRRSMHSARLDKLDATRREDKTELLYEAELEIVSTRRSRSRSMSRFRGVSEAATELPLPGAWNGTPKRKRSALQHVQPSQPQPTTPTWGVSQWKKLEKVFRAEREIWVTERSVKAMPGGFIGWARMSTFGPPAAVAKPWDPTRVVNRLLDEQGVKVDEQVGDWSRELLYTRVEALERHAEQRKVKDQTKATEPSPKKAKTTPAAQSAAPPSTVRKLFGWVLPGSTPKTSTVKDKPTGPSREEKGKGKAGDEGQTFRDRLEAIQDRPMAQVISDSVSRPTTIPIAPPHPSSPAWKNAAGPSRLPISASTSDQANQQSRPTPRTLSAILAESSSSTSSSYDRPRLHSSLSQRSAALDALFSGSTTVNTAAVRVPSIKKSTSVRDMVRSFEESGAIDLSLSMKGGEGHKR